MDGFFDDLIPQDSGQLPSPSWQDQGLSGDLIPQEAGQPPAPSWQWQTPFDDLIPPGSRLTWSSLWQGHTPFDDLIPQAQASGPDADLTTQESGETPAPSWQWQTPFDDLIPPGSRLTWSSLWQGHTPFDDLIPQQQGDAAGTAQDDASTDDGSLASFAGPSEDDNNAPGEFSAVPDFLYKPVSGASTPADDSGDASSLLSQLKQLFSPAPAKPGNGISIDKETPADAVHYNSGGDEFDAPPHADFQAVYMAGKKDGWASWGSAQRAIAQYGEFDFQRDKSANKFYGCYTHASNYAVGVYMRGAGYSIGEMLALGLGYAAIKSKNFGTKYLEQMYWWIKGWIDANAGMLATRVD
jgi:hypothetical protein